MREMMCTVCLGVSLIAAPALAQEPEEIEDILPEQQTSFTLGVLDALQGNLDATAEWSLGGPVSLGASLGVGYSWLNALSDQDLYNVLASGHARYYFDTFQKGWFLVFEAMFKYQFGFEGDGWRSVPDAFEMLGLPEPILGPGLRATGELYVGYKSIALEGGFTWECFLGLNGGVERVENIFNSREVVVQPTLGLDLGLGLGYSW